jgi:hypothetical protein
VFVVFFLPFGIPLFGLCVFVFVVFFLPFGISVFELGISSLLEGNFPAWLPLLVLALLVSLLLALS